MIVNNEVDFRDVQSSGSEVCGDENSGLVASEHPQICYSLSIFHEGVELSGLVFELHEGLANQSALFTGFDKDDDLVSRVVCKYLEKIAWFEFLRSKYVVLCESLDGFLSFEG